MSATASFAERVGSKSIAASKRSATSTWYTPFMDAASRAIAERLPLVDFVLDVRDARIPLSSEYQPLSCLGSSSKHIIVLNKIDLVKRLHLKEWIRHFEGKYYAVFGINSHNKNDTREFLNFLQGQVRALNKIAPEKRTMTMMLVGIPNVGKSALANSLHHIGRISAIEKGKLRHAIVSPLPGETKSISSLKIASHPNIYILDSPGVLPPQIMDSEVCAKLALTGALRDSLAGEAELARYFLSIINTSDEYQKWGNLLAKGNGSSSVTDNEVKASGTSKILKRPSKAYSTDHTQDFVVSVVRRNLTESIMSFKGDMEDKCDLSLLIEEEIKALIKAFSLPDEASEDDSYLKACAKLLNLYRTGRLGHYTLDAIPRDTAALLQYGKLKT